MQTESDKPTVGLAAAAAEVVATEAEQAALASPVDPLPTPEEIAEAAAATASVRPSSAVEESTTEPALKGLGKGLGGAGLARRKSKPSGSTVSAATAPAALAVRNKKSGAAADAAGPNGVGSSISTNAPIAAGAGSKARKGLSANAAPANSNAAAGGGGGGESVKLDMSSVADDVDEDASGEWESASTDEDVSQLLVSAGNPAAASAATTASRTAATPASSSSSPATWKQMLYDTFDETTLLVCGTVLGVCAGSLLILAGRAYLSR